MKSLLFSALLFLASLGSLVGLSSCTSNSGGAGDGSYNAPTSLTPAQATNQMRNQYRQEFR